MNRRIAPASFLAFCLGAGLAVAACSGPQAPPEPAPSDAPEPAVASLVNATVIVNKCPDGARVNIRMAEDAIRKLVGPCATVPGGRAHFSATLQPGGRIDLAAPDGDPADGVVPTCVLQNRLVHHVLLKSPCALDVQLDERQMTVPAATASATASAVPVPASAMPSATPSAAPVPSSTSSAAPSGSAASASAKQSSYIACGCGCCGGVTPSKQCLYHEKGDDLAKIIAADRAASKRPSCANVGCSRGTEYVYCD